MACRCSLTALQARRLMTEVMSCRNIIKMPLASKHMKMFVIAQWQLAIVRMLTQRKCLGWGSAGLSVIGAHFASSTGGSVIIGLTPCSQGADTITHTLGLTFTSEVKKYNESHYNILNITRPWLILNWCVLQMCLNCVSPANILKR